MRAPGDGHAVCWSHCRSTRLVRTLCRTSLTGEMRKVELLADIGFHPISESTASRSDDRNMGKERIHNAVGWRLLNLGLPTTRSRQGTVQRPHWADIVDKVGDCSDAGSVDQEWLRF